MCWVSSLELTAKIDPENLSSLPTSRHFGIPRLIKKRGLKSAKQSHKFVDPASNDYELLWYRAM